MKVKNYYDIEYGKYLAKKIKAVYPDFDDSEFISLIEPTLESLEFNDRQILLANALKKSIPFNYSDTIKIFEKILGPEIEGSLGMFT